MTESMMDLFGKKARAGDGQFAIAWAILSLADTLVATNDAIMQLGVGDAFTGPRGGRTGAIEALGQKVGEAATIIASGLQEIAQSREPA